MRRLQMRRLQMRGFRMRGLGMRIHRVAIAQVKSMEMAAEGLEVKRFHRLLVDKVVLSAA